MTCPGGAGIDFLLAALTCGFRAAGPRPKLDGVAFVFATLAGEGGRSYSGDEKRIEGTRGVVIKYAFTIRIAPPLSSVFRHNQTK